MQAYIIRRVLLIIPTLFLISIIVFFTLRFIPGDVVDLLVAQLAMGGGDVKELRKLLEQQLGLDAPAYVQYGRWITGALQGDFGNSLWTGTPVFEDILLRLPVSIELGILTIIIGFIVSLPVGIISGLRPESTTDNLLRSFAILLITVPTFWLATMILLYGALWWHWSPVLTYVEFWEDPLANLGIMIIPALLMGMWFSGFTMRMTRTLILEVLRQDYVRTAWAKGLRERVVVIRHVVKNTLIPLVTILGLQVPVLIGGAVVVEIIFSLPGVGALLVDALKIRDYTVVSAINVVLAGFVLIVNLLVDISYAWLDPRIHFR